MHLPVHSSFIASSPQREHFQRSVALWTAVTRQRTREIVCTSIPSLSLRMSSMRYRLGICVILSSAGMQESTTLLCAAGLDEAVSLVEIPEMFGGARFSTTIDEHASKRQ